MDEVNSIFRLDYNIVRTGGAKAKALADAFNRQTIDPAEDRKYKSQI
jgi:hypothetical protein